MAKSGHGVVGNASEWPGVLPAPTPAAQKLSSCQPISMVLAPIGMLYAYILSSYIMSVQSTLGFATMDIAANLDLATARALTDFHQYINTIYILL